VTRFLTGTSGYSYKEWKGEFYPGDLPDAEMLRFYGTRFETVEINNTFYRLPKAPVVASWADQVPETFRFVIKASRRITHFKGLRDAWSETDYLYSILEGLGPRLGAVLFQLPPHLRADLPRLEKFLQRIPAGSRAVFEFRHPSWLTDETAACLREAGAALCAADDTPGEEIPLVETASWGYMRLRRASYTDAELTEWARRIRDTAWTEAFVFFKHETGADGPELATRFHQLVSSP
jgi:uncharacterized protein YecE (DUF72 family)